ncbi:hypothetical protein M8B99_10545 [Enterobacter hormaechei subsp. hoffmannii]|nr:hypothetical protein [Enterobacter hormaechei]MCW4712680.1 hypothetical protein [Enterobacter hormaechei subsp. hoffmannii]
MPSRSKTAPAQSAARPSGLPATRASVPINNTESPLYPLLPGDNTLTFFLRYKSTLPTVTTGNATAVMYFDLLYQ